MNIEEIGTPYALDRRGIVQRTGPSAETSPGERELFDHTNLWIPGPEFQNYAQSFTAIGAGSSAVSRSFRAFPKTGTHKAYVTVRRPRLWTAGNVTGRIWYAGLDADDTLVYSCGTQFSLLGEDASSTIEFSTMFFDLPATATGGEFNIYRGLEDDTTGKGYVAIDSQAHSIRVLFQRLGSDVDDTAVDSLEFIGFELIYRPSLVESTGLPPWLMME